MIFRDNLEEGEMIARAYLERHKWKIHSLQDARLIPAERFSVMPQEAQAALRVRPMHVEIHSYETGGGPEVAPELSWMREDRERQKDNE